MLRQFDIVANPDSSESPSRPYLVVLQSDLLTGLASIVVAPLIPRARMTGARRLNPIVPVQGHEYWLATHELFAVNRHMLGGALGNIRAHRDAITAALDLIFLGF